MLFKSYFWSWRIFFNCDSTFGKWLFTFSQRESRERTYLRAWNQGFISSVIVRDSLLQWHKTTVSWDTGKFMSILVFESIKSSAALQNLLASPESRTGTGWCVTIGGKLWGQKKLSLSSLFFSGDVTILEDWLQNNAKLVGVRLNLENES